MYRNETKFDGKPPTDQQPIKQTLVTSLIIHAKK